MNKKVGKLIKKRRKHFKLTQEELAKKLNVSSSMVSYWETGKGVPDEEMISIICKVLKIREKKFEEEKDIKIETYTVSEISKKDNIIIKVLKFIILFLIIYVLLSTVSTIYYNTLSYYSRRLTFSKFESVSDFARVDKKIKKQADYNLEKIKNTTNTNYDEEHKNKLIKNLEKMSESCDKLENISYKIRNNYDVAVYALKVKTIIGGSGDMEALGAILNTDSRNKEEKYKEEAYQLFQKRVGIEYEIMQENSSIIFPEYKYPNPNNIYRIISMQLVSKTYGFSYDKYYLALTEYAMKVGGINE